MAVTVRSHPIRPGVPDGCTGRVLDDGSISHGGHRWAQICPVHKVDYLPGGRFYGGTL